MVKDGEIVYYRTKFTHKQELPPRKGDGVHTQSETKKDLNEKNKG